MDQDIHFSLEKGFLLPFNSVFRPETPDRHHSRSHCGLYEDFERRHQAICDNFLRRRRNRFHGRNLGEVLLQGKGTERMIALKTLNMAYLQVYYGYGKYSVIPN